MNNEKVDLSKTKIPKWKQEMLSDQSKELIILINKYYDKQDKIENTKKRLLNEENDAKQQLNKIQKICNHKWEYEAPCYHERSYKYCSICNLYK